MMGFILYSRSTSVWLLLSRKWNLKIGGWKLGDQPTNNLILFLFHPDHKHCYGEKRVQFFMSGVSPFLYSLTWCWQSLCHKYVIFISFCRCLTSFLRRRKNLKMSKAVGWSGITPSEIPDALLSKLCTTGLNTSLFHWNNGALGPISFPGMLWCWLVSYRTVTFVAITGMIITFNVTNFRIFTDW
jgi:hypothetical protein